MTTRALVIRLCRRPGVPSPAPSTPAACAYSSLGEVFTRAARLRFGTAGRAGPGPRAGPGRRSGPPVRTGRGSGFGGLEAEHPDLARGLPLVLGVPPSAGRRPT